ncbi:MAG: hypothetical protein ACPGXY_03480 [Alphaproteobacteria bacterium]
MFNKFKFLFVLALSAVMLNPAIGSEDNVNELVFKARASVNIGELEFKAEEVLSSVANVGPVDDRLEDSWELMNPTSSYEEEKKQPSALKQMVIAQAKQHAPTYVGLGVKYLVEFIPYGDKVTYVSGKIAEAAFGTKTLTEAAIRGFIRLKDKQTGEVVAKLEIVEQEQAISPASTGCFADALDEMPMPEFTTTTLLGNVICATPKIVGGMLKAGVSLLPGGGKVLKVTGFITTKLDPDAKSLLEAAVNYAVEKKNRK